MSGACGREQVPGGVAAWRFLNQQAGVAHVVLESQISQFSLSVVISLIAAKVACRMHVFDLRCAEEGYEGDRALLLIRAGSTPLSASRR